MSGSDTAADEEKRLMEGKVERDLQPVQSDDEDDYEGYFLDPVGGNVNISEKIAEANQKLLEEEEVEDGNDKRPRKVQFSENLVNYEPIYYSDEDDYTESGQNSVISEEDSELKLSQDEFDNSKAVDQSQGSQNSGQKTAEDDIPEEIVEETPLKVSSFPDCLNERSPKFVLVLVPKDQNSSCESIIGEDVTEEKSTVEEFREKEKPTKTKIARPKSAKKSWEVSKISPNLSCSSSLERKSWDAGRNHSVRSKGKVEGRENKNMFAGEIKVHIKGRFLKKINIDDLSLEDVTKGETLKRCGSRPRSCYRGVVNTSATSGGDNRPKSAPLRTCCVTKTELPSYNGLRSEYGLSEEQLQERKQKALESRQHKKQEQIRKRQEEMRKRSENEETFQKWLFNKTKKNFKKSVKPLDTLTRSDVFIQTHASYAANRNVPYSLDYNLTRKISKRKKELRGRKNKTISVEKLFENTLPHFKRSFNIYLGMK